MMRPRRRSPGSRVERDLSGARDLDPEQLPTFTLELDADAPKRSGGRLEDETSAWTSRRNQPAPQIDDASMIPLDSQAPRRAAELVSTS